MNLTTPEIMARRKIALEKTGYTLYRTTNTPTLYSPIWRMNVDLLNPYFKNMRSFCNWMGINFSNGEFNLLLVIKKRTEQLSKWKHDNVRWEKHNKTLEIWDKL